MINHVLTPPPGGEGKTLGSNQIYLENEQIACVNHKVGTTQ